MTQYYEKELNLDDFNNLLVSGDSWDLRIENGRLYQVPSTCHKAKADSLVEFEIDDSLDKSVDYMPHYATEDSVGMDLVSAEDFALAQGETKMVYCGLRLKHLDSNHVLQIRSRAGLASRGICVANSPGTVDPDYRGPIKVILVNLTTPVFYLHKGDRIAQAVICPIKREPSLAVNSVKRGTGGFGSTGN